MILPNNQISEGGNSGDDERRQHSTNQGSLVITIKRSFIELFFFSSDIIIKGHGPNRAKPKRHTKATKTQIQTN